MRPSAACRCVPMHHVKNMNDQLAASDGEHTCGHHRHRGREPLSGGHALTLSYSHSHTSTPLTADAALAVSCLQIVSLHSSSRARTPAPCLSRPASCSISCSPSPSCPPTYSCPPPPSPSRTLSWL